MQVISFPFFVYKTPVSYSACRVFPKQTVEYFVHIRTDYPRFSFIALSTIFIFLYKELVIPLFRFTLSPFYYDSYR